MPVRAVSLVGLLLTVAITPVQAITSVSPRIGPFTIGMLASEAEDAPTLYLRVVEDADAKLKYCPGGTLYKATGPIELGRRSHIGVRYSVCARGQISRVVSVAAFIPIEAFAGGIDLYRSMKELRDSFRSLPGIVVDEDGPLDFMAHVSNVHIFVEENDDYLSVYMEATGR